MKQKKDAAQVLQKDPFTNIEKRLNVQASQTFSNTENLEPKTTQILSKNKEKSGKFEFMFVDSSKKDKVVLFYFLFNIL
jgi:hypothetical protein